MPTLFVLTTATMTIQPLELPPLTPAFRREVQRMYTRLQRMGATFNDNMTRRLAGGELTYRDLAVMFYVASDAAGKAAIVCNPRESAEPTDGCYDPDAQDFCVPNTAKHPLRAQLAYQREARPGDAHKGRWPLTTHEQEAFRAWFDASKCPYDKPASADDDDLSDGNADLETKVMSLVDKKLEDVKEGLNKNSRKFDALREIIVEMVDNIVGAEDTDKPEKMEKRRKVST